MLLVGFMFLIDLICVIWWIDVLNWYSLWSLLDQTTHIFRYNYLLKSSMFFHSKSRVVAFIIYFLRLILQLTQGKEVLHAHTKMIFINHLKLLIRGVQTKASSQTKSKNQTKSRKKKPTYDLVWLDWSLKKKMIILGLVWC